MKRLAELLTAEKAKQFLQTVDNFLLDCDGVLWNGGLVLENATQVVNKLQQLGKKVFLVTNNSTKTQDEYASKCEKLGFNCEKWQILCTSYLVAQHLRSRQFDKKVYLVGSEGLARELDLAGIRHTGLGPDLTQGNVFDGQLDRLQFEPDIGAVVVGFDSHISFMKVLRAATYLRRPDCLYIATNRDERFPTDHIVCPGTGTMVAMVSMAAAREPTVMGKPSERVFETLRERHGLDPARTVMVGDNCKTDITMGNLCGLHTLAVMTGVTKPEELEQLRAQPGTELQVPEFWLPQFGDLLPFL